MEFSRLHWEVSALCSKITCLDPPLEVGLSDLPPLEILFLFFISKSGGGGMEFGRVNLKSEADQGNDETEWL